MSEPVVTDFNHVGLVVPDVDKACAFFEKVFGIKCTDCEKMVPHLKIRFATLKNAKMEIIQPLTEDCDHGRWLKEHPLGGIHHICFHTKDVAQGTKQLQEAGVRPLDPVPLKLDNGQSVQFFNPEDTFGILCELAYDGY